MWSNFYAAGGWGMHVVTIFGLLMIAASVLYALRPQQKARCMVLTLGIITFCSGLLGTATGVCMTAHYIHQVELAKQLEIMALGIEESLHVVVYALILVIVSGAIAAVGHLRAAPQTAEV